MGSARRTLGLPPFRLALCLLIIVATITVAAPNFFSLFVSTYGTVGTVQPVAAADTEPFAIEGWVTSYRSGTPVAGALVTVEGGPATTSDADGYFAFGSDEIAPLANTTNNEPALFSISVGAEGYSSWTIRSARYYLGDTLRLYSKLDTAGASPEVMTAAAPRRAGEVSTLPGTSGTVVPSAPLGQSSMASSDGITSSSVAPDAASWTPPSSIRVYRSATGEVDIVPFKEYVKHVLPNEWVPTWSAGALRAGAVAVKEYGWYWVYHGGKQAALGADVKDNTEDQVYDPNVSYASTDAAVEEIWAYALLRNGTLFQTQYCAGSYQADPTGDCPWSGPYMTQWGSAYYSDQGQTWDWILQFYYRDATLVPGAPGGGSAPPPPVSAPPPTAAPSFSVGQGATQPEVFIEAYNRNGGEARIGNPTGAVQWWLPYVSENNVLAQRFSGVDGDGRTWIVFDTLKSDVSGIKRAYLIEGALAEAYAEHAPPGPAWVGAPTCDPYTANALAGGMTSQGFAGGTLAWDGQKILFTTWPTQFTNWQASYYVGRPPESLAGPQVDLPGQPALVMDQLSPDIDWSPDEGVPKSMGLGSEDWSAQFSKQAPLDAGNYDITVSADSGVRLWVDNLLAINSWKVTTSHTDHTEQYNLDLDGEPHMLRIQYFSLGGAARLAFSMSKRDPMAPPTAAPSPTADPKTTGTAPVENPNGNAGLRVTVRWLGRPAPPSDSWSQPLTLLLSVPGNPTIVGMYAGSTDRNGVAIFSGLPEGTYDVHVKGLHTLQSARASVELLPNQSVDVDMKAQVEGDLNGDNCVSVDDFAIVQAMVGTNRDTPGWNPAADLNNDGQVSATDVSLLRSGFDKCGDISADNEFHTLSTDPAPTFEQQLAPWLDPDSMRHDLSLGLSASETSVRLGDIVEVEVYAEAGSQAIDGGSFILYYDPILLSPVDSKGNPTTNMEPGFALPSVLGNWIDGQVGAIGYSASMLQGTAPDGRVPLATIRFRAVQTGSVELHFAPLSLGYMQLTNGGTNLLAQTSGLSLTLTP